MPQHFISYSKFKYSKDQKSIGLINAKMCLLVLCLKPTQTGTKNHTATCSLLLSSVGMGRKITTKDARVKTKDGEGTLANYDHGQKRLELGKQNKLNLNNRTTTSLLIESE